MKVKKKNEKAGLKQNIFKKFKKKIQKMKIMASSPISSWQIEVKKWKQ